MNTDWDVGQAGDLKGKVIMITGYATLEVARESLTKGAFDFIAKPFKIKEIKKAIEKAANSLQAEGIN